MVTWIPNCCGLPCSPPLRQPSSPFLTWHQNSTFSSLSRLQPIELNFLHESSQLSSKANNCVFLSVTEIFKSQNFCLSAHTFCFTSQFFLCFSSQSNHCFYTRNLFFSLTNFFRNISSLALGCVQKKKRKIIK